MSRPWLTQLIQKGIGLLEPVYTAQLDSIRTSRVKAMDMIAQEITDQLRSIASADYFEECSAKLTDAWSAAGVGTEVLEPVLRFMEEYPEIDFGTPGSLVHFLERFHNHGYEEKLIESIQRRPTSHTTWMLNRLINGTRAPDLRRRLIALMESAITNPAAHVDAVERATDFLTRLRN